MSQIAEAIPFADTLPPEEDLFFPALENDVRRSGARKTKNYVLDTNVLLHDPHSMHRFENNHIFIPVEVLSELDRFKNEQTERGANARAVHRALTQAFGSNPRTIMRGAKTPGGGTIRVVINDYLGRTKPALSMKKFMRIFPDLDKMDNRIIACCLYLTEKHHEPAILVTKDLNMQLKSLAIGLQAQDYLNDKVAVRDAEESGLRSVEVAPHELQRFGSSRLLDLDANRIDGLSLNEYVLLTTPEGKQMAARYDGRGSVRRLNIPTHLEIPRGIDLKPANLGQQCFLDALLDPDIPLVTCYGQAGTGKTLMAVGAGLSQVYSSDYVGLTVSRPVVAMGDTLGFLPGTLAEKMHPWLQSIYDAFDVIMPTGNAAFEARGPKKSDRKKQRTGDAPYPVEMNGSAVKIVKAHEILAERGILEIEALCYIRGRSIPNRFFVLDEAQQLTPLEAKTVVTRMSKGSKLVMVGDPGQIDNPYVDSRSNGLVYARNRLKGSPLTAHVCLMKGERSELAEMGATLM